MEGMTQVFEYVPGSNSFGRYQVRCFEKLINYLYVFVEWFPLYLRFFYRIFSRSGSFVWGADFLSEIKI